MSLYLFIKYLHITTALLSISGFLLRGVWMLQGSGYLNARLTRVLPHVNDAVLLASALTLAWMSAQYPFVHSWLTAKVLALLVYIGLGMFALKRGKTLTVRMLAWMLAVLVFAYMLSVAVSRSPAGVISYF